MIRTAGAVLAGARAALRTPRWLGGERLGTLLQPPEGARPDAVAARGAVRSALFLVRLLARLPGSPWRDTCLYRSVAECLVLRRYGVPALVRIGVRNESPPHGPIVAHAWVVRAGCEAPAAPGLDALEPLRARA
ncbi:MAG TPA: lasso peptide biosynthesis B2 protein [Longimicrobiaceae bacterium]|nr:lasso peptide biosynthesis B2 protein [Longimicrobiaceae bacterium]